jgi:hypothetical protein
MEPNLAGMIFMKRRFKYLQINYTLYTIKYPGFWLIDIQCIFYVVLYF